MDEYWAGISTWWATQTATNFYVGIGGRLRNGVARQDETKPYCVLTQVDGIPEFFQDDGYDELYHIENQFDIYSEDNSEVLALSKKAMALFDDATFVISGWNMILQFNRTRNLLMPPEIAGLVGKTEFDFILYRYFLTYDVVLQKARV